MLVTAVVFPLAVMGQENAQRILGKWYTVERSRGGIGAIMEFRTDGTVKYSPGAIVEFAYTFDGQKLTFKFTDPLKGPQPENVEEVRVLSREKMTTQPTGSKASTAVPVEWARVGSPEDQDHLLLGSWTAPREMEGHKVSNNWRFRADGSAVLTVPFLDQVGQYRLIKDSIRLNVDRAISVEGPISWEGEILVLPGHQSPTKMHRF